MTNQINIGLKCDVLSILAYLSAFVSALTTFLAVRGKTSEVRVETKGQAIIETEVLTLKGKKTIALALVALLTSVVAQYYKDEDEKKASLERNWALSNQLEVSNKTLLEATRSRTLLKDSTVTVIGQGHKKWRAEDFSSQFPKFELQEETSRNYQPSVTTRELFSYPVTARRVINFRNMGCYAVIRTSADKMVIDGNVKVTTKGGPALEYSVERQMATISAKSDTGSIMDLFGNYFSVYFHTDSDMEVIFPQTIQIKCNGFVLIGFIKNPPTEDKLETEPPRRARVYEGRFGDKFEIAD